MKRCRYLCCIILSLIMNFIISSSGYTETLRFVAPLYCPFTCDPAKENGKKGIVADIVLEAFSPHYQVEIHMMPYLRAIQYVKNGEHDGIICYGKEYAPELVSPEIPSISQKVAFWVHRDTPWEYDGYDTLGDITIGIVKGYKTGDNYLDNYLNEQDNLKRITKISSTSVTQQGLNMLYRDRFTTFIEGEFTAKYVISKLGYEDELKIAGFLEKPFEIYTGFNPKHPKAAQLSKQLEKTLIDVYETGKIYEIFKRYNIAIGNISKDDM